MRLYHGTSERHVESILKNGLCTRAVTGEANNFLECPSHDDCVYVTTCYAPYFAGVAAGKAKDRWAVVELEVEEEDLLPDEDFLEQATRHHADDPRSKLSMVERTAYFRENLFDYAPYALDSLSNLGTAAVPDGVPITNILRISLFTPTRNNYVWSMAMDPTISLMNHRFLSARYKELTRWFFEPDVVPEQLHAGVWEHFTAEARRLAQVYIEDRAALELLILTQ